jgi:hypothetical protein
MSELGCNINSLLFLKVCQQMWDQFNVQFHKAKPVFQNPLDWFLMNPQSGCNGLL